MWKLQTLTFLVPASSCDFKYRKEKEEARKEDSLFQKQLIFFRFCQIGLFGVQFDLVRRVGSGKNNNELNILYELIWVKALSKFTTITVLKLLFLTPHAEGCPVIFPNLAATSMYSEVQGLICCYRTIILILQGCMSFSILDASFTKNVIVVVDVLHSYLQYIQQ